MDRTPEGHVVGRGGRSTVPRIRSLRMRIVVAFALLLLGVQAISVAVINTVLTRNAYRSVEQDLRSAERIFKLLHEDNRRQLAQAARILSSDFAFREAIATSDRETLTSVLLNHGNRIQADLMMLAGLDNRLVADTRRPDLIGGQFPFPRLIARAERDGEASAVVARDGRAYELVVVPVLAPQPIAWVAMGFAVDDAFARRLQSLSSLDVSVVAATPSGGDWSLLATSLSRADRDALERSLSSLRGAGTGIRMVEIGGDEFMTLLTGLGLPEDGAILAVLQKSLTQAIAPLKRLQTFLLGLGGAALAASFLASVMIARNMTRPLGELSAIANRVAQGDYSQAVQVDREDEIGRLAGVFNQMREGIAAREARIVQLAYTDMLTGLPNRSLFQERLEQSIRSARREGRTPTVLIMDLDRFKEVNDTLGHHIGDLLLQEAGRRLAGVLSRASDSVTRLGGDEFAVLLPTSGVEGAQVIARRLLEALDVPMILEGQQIIVGASIGIASYPEHGDDVNTLLQHADVAMYSAKRADGGFAVYDLRTDQQSRQRVSLMAELRQAVERDELTLQYQPKINLASGACDHAEALVRWIHPERGFVPAGQFIPYAERTGYIKAITRWVIGKALAQCSEWRADGLAVRVAINLSARDLHSPELGRAFDEFLKAHAATPDWLSLEITESAIMTDPGHAKGVLDHLRAMGFHLSLDDFGTGYSSLSYLKRLPVDELKIDQSFVRDMAANRDDAAIVRATIDLGHTLGLRVVAEGIEDAATLDLLRTLGCDQAQGYFISRPLGPAELKAWIAKAPRSRATLHAV